MKCSCGNDKFKPSVRMINQKGCIGLGIKMICTECGKEKQEDKTNAEYGLE